MSNTTETARPTHLNIRVDAEFWDAVEALRRARSPIPSTSDLIRALVFEAYTASGAAKKRKGRG